MICLFCSNSKIILQFPGNEKGEVTGPWGAQVRAFKDDEFDYDDDKDDDDDDEEDDDDDDE